MWNSWMNRTPRSASRRVQLDEPHAALRQPPREQEVGRKGSRLSRFRTVELKHTLRLLGKIGQLRNRILHPVCHLVLRDPRRDLGVSELFQTELIELAQILHEPAPRRIVEALRIR